MVGLENLENVFQGSSEKEEESISFISGSEHEEEAIPSFRLEQIEFDNETSVADLQKMLKEAIDHKQTSKAVALYDTIIHKTNPEQHAKSTLLGLIAEEEPSTHDKTLIEKAYKGFPFSDIEEEVKTHATVDGFAKAFEKAFDKLGSKASLASNKDRILPLFDAYRSLKLRTFDSKTEGPQRTFKKSKILD